MVLLTSLKVVFYDLSYLEDLYRVASLVGLAFALLLIAFVYSRLAHLETEPTRGSPDS